MMCCHDTWFHLKLTILKPWVKVCLMEMFVLSYVNVPQTLSSSGFRQMAQNLLDKPVCYTQILFP